MSADVAPAGLPSGAWLPRAFDEQFHSLELVDGRHAEWAAPFYHLMVRRLVAAGAPRISAPLDQFRALVPGPPAVVILNAGRSGSTAVSRALETIAAVLSVREPDPFTELLTFPIEPDHPRANVVAAVFRAASAVLNARAADQGLALSMKLASVSTLSLRFLLELWPPPTQFVISVRDPSEVAASAQGDVPSWVEIYRADLDRARTVLPSLERVDRHLHDDPVVMTAALWAEAARNVNEFGSNRVAVIEHDTIGGTGVESLRTIAAAAGIEQVGQPAAVQSVLRSDAKTGRPYERRRRSSELSDEARAMVAAITEPEWTRLRQRPLFTATS